MPSLGYELGLNGPNEVMYSTAVSYPSTIAALKALGATVSRQQIASTSMTVGQVQPYYNACQAAGIQLVLVETLPDPLPNTTTHAANLATVAAACPDIWWEIGNEPDQVPAISASLYPAFFSAAVTAIKAADPTCKIGPCPVSNINGGGGGQTWLAAAFTAGLAAIPYDFLPFHNYPYPTALPPTTAWSGPYTAITLIPQFTAWATGQGNTKPYWNTECGWQDVDTSASPNMTAALQASYMVTYLQAIAGYGLPVVIPYAMYDSGSQAYGWMDQFNYNLSNQYYTPRDVYTAVQALTTSDAGNFFLFL